MVLYMLGTEFVLIAVNGDISLDITWNRGNDVIASDTRTTVSTVNGSGENNRLLN